METEIEILPQHIQVGWTNTKLSLFIENSALPPQTILFLCFFVSYTKFYISSWFFTFILSLIWFGFILFRITVRDQSYKNYVIQRLLVPGLASSSRHNDFMLTSSVFPSNPRRMKSLSKITKFLIRIINPHQRRGSGLLQLN